MTHAVPAIIFDHVTVCYHGVPAVERVCARFEAGSSWAIVGANGAGKSTLLKAAMRLVPCDTGAVRWEHLQRQDIAYLAQQADIDRNLPVLVQDLVVLGLWHELRWWRRVSRAQWVRVHAALERVGMLAMARCAISDLSSGQFQRVLFARMLVQRARFLLLDEPFNAMDAATTAELLQVLHACTRQGAGVVAVVHDQAQARDHFDHVLVLDKTVVGVESAETAGAVRPDAGGR
jgi:zinc/manganese transport system ATP-binding protein